MPIPFFRCEKCRKEFNSYEDAEKCENSHLVPIEVSIKTHSFRPYPYSLEVLFSDGKAKIYNAEELGG